ncbi:hypothetical protein BU23DRAFT_272974 [Bimuria novae-zelandiae CBS 107.79]|uniref:Uncharacterized protein n=1 Tax=Bimuria novae-zelandiae CBS 107.79 TaxID=1447943 RepID=A0A6A5VPX0_9PLEO|nr:hypothetical protein BU23DRAFT_272974 [Bimuria novae-zelandiae CBS 107.79]
MPAPPMDELYVFGYGYNKQFPSSLRPGDDPVQRPEHLDVKTVSTPTRTLHAESIEILWASWCDLISLTVE